MSVACVEERIQVDDLNFAVKRWGDHGAPAVIALHGWLDNAASFDVLAPLLSRCQVIAIDLSGHGLTSHRSRNSQYLIWSDVLPILAIADHYGLEQFQLLGHSRGGMIATLVACSAPQRVSKMVILDSLMPHASPPEDALKNLREFVRDERKYFGHAASNTPRLLPSLDDAVAARQKLMPIEAESARRILSRGSIEHDQGLELRHDQRLKGRSAAKFTAEQNAAILSGLECPTLYIICKSHMKSAEHLLKLSESKDHIVLNSIEGNHHFHMEAPAERAAPVIEAFYYDEPLPPIE